MTYKLKLIVATLLWVFYGAFIWIITEWTEPRTTVMILGIVASAFYFLLLTCLFFGPKRVL